MIIDLNMNGNKPTGAKVDFATALMDLHTAEEGFTVTCAKYDLLTTACENIEAGIALSEAIAAKGDDNTAVAVATESLRQNLKVIGQEHLTSEVVTPGTESIVAANEGIKDILKKAWEAVKALGAKIWKWITSVFKKVYSAVGSAIGSGSNVDKLITELREIVAAKKEGLTVPDMPTDEDKANAIASHYKIYSTLFSGKKFGKAGIKDVAASLSSKPASLTALETTTAIAEAMANNAENFKAEEVAKLYKDLEVPAADFDVNSVAYLKNIETELKNKAGFDKDSDTKVKVVRSSFSATKISVLVISVNKKAMAGITTLAGATSNTPMSDITDAMDDVASGYKMKLIDLSADDLELKDKDFVSKIELLNAADCLEVVNAIKTAGESVSKNGDMVSKGIDRLKSRAEKAFKDLDTAIAKSLKADESKAKSAQKAALSAAKAFNAVTVTAAKDVTKLAISNADNILKSSILTVVTESMAKF